LHRGHTLVPKWADTHITLEPPVSGARLHWGRNHCANINIHTYALFSDTNVWNYHCDGAYPQPQWDCACSAYNNEDVTLVGDQKAHPTNTKAITTPGGYGNKEYHGCNHSPLGTPVPVATDALH
jgi:hypothetical protein